MIGDGSANVEQFQFSVVCHVCGTANTITLCSGCGRLINTVHTHCYHCGLALRDPDEIEKASARDEIVFDYNGQPIVSGSGNVLDYLAAMVREVKERAVQMGLTSSTRFVFKMTPDLWEDISSLYACRVPSGTGLMPVEEIYERRAELRARQSIIVDGIEYPVELGKGCKRDIFFVPESEQTHPIHFLTAVLQKVGIK